MTQQRFIRIVPLALAGAAICGCSSTETVPALEDARAAVSAAERDPAVAEMAAPELERALEALREAEATFAEEGDDEPALLAHQAYVAEQLAALAQTEARVAMLNEQIEDAEAERSQVLLQARTREAAQAEREATLAEREAQAAEARARVAAGAAVESAREAERLRQRIEDLEMRETDRGLVLTLDEVLFDFDEAELKPGADSMLNRLADFLDEYENRSVLIEGHTDSTGSESYNRMLSQQRADAVRNALMQRGVAASRIETVGIGEAQPVASNDNAAGRQLNRRVEVVISSDSDSNSSASDGTGSDGDDRSAALLRSALVRACHESSM